MTLTIEASKAVSVTVATQDGTAGTARLIISYQVQDYLENTAANAGRYNL